MKTLVLSFSFIICILACTEPRQTITVAAAADLQYALDEVRAEFLKAHPSHKLDIIYGSSGNLYQQIVNKAPFDIFFSADLLYPAKLDSAGLTATSPKLYAIGFLVLWTQKFDVSGGMDILLNPDVKRIAIANPRHAPYGKRAMEALKYYGLYDKVKKKLVEGENISQAAQFVLTGNAEVGIIALSLAMSPTMQQAGKFHAINEKSYSPLHQAYVILKGSETKSGVRQFYDFAGTSPAREIFSKYGFRLPNE